MGGIVKDLVRHTCMCFKGEGFRTILEGLVIYIGEPVVLSGAHFYPRGYCVWINQILRVPEASFKKQYLSKQCCLNNHIRLSSVVSVYVCVYVCVCVCVCVYVCVCV